MKSLKTVALACGESWGRCRQPVRSFLAEAVWVLARLVGLVRLFQFLNRKKIAILMMHGVTGGEEGASWRPMRPFMASSRLEEHLKALSRRYRFVPLMDAVDMLQGRQPLQPYRMVLTFDDGYLNNLTCALPILERFSVPATIFVATGFVNDPKPFWFDRLDYAVQHAQVDGRELTIGSMSARLDCSGRASLVRSFVKFVRAAQEQGLPDLEFQGEVMRLIAELEAESGRSLLDIHAADAWTAIATWEQLNASACKGLTVGSHTVDHICLGAVDTCVARDQLVRSKEEIETRTGKPCLSVAYPGGSCDEETVAIARDSGFICGLTTVSGLNGPGDDPMALKRMGVNVRIGSGELLADVCGLSACLFQVKNRLLRRPRRGVGLRPRSEPAWAREPRA